MLAHQVKPSFLRFLQRILATEDAQHLLVLVHQTHGRHAAGAQRGRERAATQARRCAAPAHRMSSFIGGGGGPWSRRTKGRPRPMEGPPGPDGGRGVNVEPPGRGVKVDPPGRGVNVVAPPPGRGA